MLQAALDMHLLDIQEGDILPVGAFSGDRGWENSVQVAGGAEGGTDDVVGVKLVVIFQFVQ